MSMAGLATVIAAAAVALAAFRDRRAPVLTLVAYAPFNGWFLAQFDHVQYANPVNGLLALAVVAAPFRPAARGADLPPARRSEVARGVALMAGAATLALALALGRAPDRAADWITEWKRLATPFLLFALVLRHVAEPRDLPRILVLLALAATTIAALSVRDYLRIGGYDPDKRPETVLGQANELAAYLCQATLLLGIAALEARALDGRLRLLLGAAAGASAIGMLFAFSRGAYLAAIAGAGAYALARRPVLVPAMAMALALAPVWLPSSVLARVNEGVGESGVTDTSLLSRFEVWSATAAMTVDHPLGVGLGLFGETVAPYLAAPREIDAHNQYLKCLGEQGPQGLAALVFLLAAAAIVSRRVALRHPDPRARALGIAVGATVVATAVLCVSGSRLESPESPALFWCALALVARFDVEIRVVTRAPA